MRFFGPQQTALLQKPHYLNTDLVLKLQFGTFEFPKSTFFDRFCYFLAYLDMIIELFMVNFAPLHNLKQLMMFL